jgi:hypothetical protein
LLLAEILVGKVLDQLALAAPELYLLVEEELRQSLYEDLVGETAPSWSCRRRTPQSGPAVEGDEIKS